MPSSSLPPGPRLPSFAQGFLGARYPISFLERCQRRFGDCFTMRFPFFGSVVYVADPAVVEELFKGDPKRFHAGAANAGPLGPVMGTYSLLTLDEEEHMSQRKLLTPAFHGENVRRYGELMEEIAERELERWPEGESFPLRPRMHAIALEVILRAVFGVREEERLRQLRLRITRLGQVSSLVVWLPGLRRNLGRWSPWMRFLRARAAVDELLYDEIARRRADPGATERQDVLSLLLQARHDDGTPMSVDELRDELMTLLGAGHETTATALAWTFERLVRHPTVLERLIESLEAGEDEYLDAVVKETLRVRPVVADVARKLVADTKIKGHTIPGGTIVL